MRCDPATTSTRFGTVPTCVPSTVRVAPAPLPSPEARTSSTAGRACFSRVNTNACERSIGSTFSTGLYPPSSSSIR